MSFIFSIYYGLKSLFCDHQFISVETKLHATRIYECSKCYKIEAFHDFTPEEQFAYRKLR